MRLIRLAFLVLGILVVLLVVGVVLMAIGSPAACVDRVIQPSSASSAELKAQWAKLKQAPTTITLTEQQVTSRGVEYIEQKDVPVEDLQVYFCPDGTAEGAGQIKLAFLKPKVVARGTLDLSGPKPKIQIDEIKAGSLPSGIAKPAVDLILNTGNFRTLDLREKLTDIRYGDGNVTIAGGP